MENKSHFKIVYPSYSLIKGCDCPRRIIAFFVEVIVLTGQFSERVQTNLCSAIGPDCLSLQKGGDVMGFWYLLLLLIGVILIIIGIMKKGVSSAVKVVILLFVIGILFVVVSIVLLMPGSSDLIAELLKLDW